MGYKITKEMKKQYIIPFILLIIGLVFGCKKTNPSKTLTNIIVDSEWKLDKVIDSNGLDVKVQFVNDSAICECFKINKVDKKKQFNTLLFNCKNTFYENYMGSWEIKSYESFGTKYAYLYISQINSELFNSKQFRYLNLQHEEIGAKDYLVHHIFSRVGTYSTKLIYKLYFKKTT